VAFPPNYRQERSNRERAKQRKALEKQSRRDERAAQRKDTADAPNPEQDQDTPPAKDS
jgi:hypothetical protein